MATEITKILAIIDTRQFEEQDDRWVPIPGSGQDNECARCNRLHEIHAHVELSDGTTAVIGTGCARGTSMSREMQVEGPKATKRAAAAAELRWIEEEALPAVFKLQRELAEEKGGMEVTEGVVTLGTREVKTWEMDGLKIWRQLGNSTLTKEQAQPRLLRDWERREMGTRWDGPSLIQLQRRRDKLTP